MKRKYIVLIAILSTLLLCSGLWARPTSAYDAEIAVTGWLKADIQPFGIPIGRQVSEIDTFSDDGGEVIYYIVYLRPSGFVIVSADDLIEPIIGYADDGIFDPSFENPLGALVNNDLKNRKEKVRSNFTLLGTFEKAPETEKQSKWKNLKHIAQTYSSGFNLMSLSCLSDIRVAPLIQSQWNQTSACDLNCYNYYTNFGTSTRYPCGCLATAMAQLMRYYEYPTNGIGEHVFTIKVNDNERTAVTRGGDGNGGPYNWDDMVLRPESECETITKAQRQAIGSICYDAGVAIETSYFSDGSGAMMSNARIAFDETFQYRNIVIGYNSNENIDTEYLYDMINPNLDAQAPVIISIFGSPNSEYGHAVICDGYAYTYSTSEGRDDTPYEVPTLYHHINMGWSGVDDAWYNLPNIDGAREYSMIQACLYNIFPSDTGEIISGRVLDPNGNPIAGANVYAQSDGQDPHTTVTNHKGIYAFKGLYSNTPYTVWVDVFGDILLAQLVITGFSEDDTTISGNRWHINFQTDTEPNFPPPVFFFVDNNAPDDPGHNNTNISDPLEDGSFEHPFDAIQEAVDVAEHGDVVFILQGIYTGEGNRDIDTKGKAITIRGEDPNNPNLVIIDSKGTADEPHRGFVFHSYEDSLTILADLTITDGYIDYGGAIYCKECANPTISNCIISSNYASGVGGGMYNSESNPTLIDCIFIDNTSDAGAAMYNYGDLPGCNPVITNCTFYSNTAIFNGGAIYNNGKVSPVLSDCTFILNSSSGGGGAIRNIFSAAPALSNCIFFNNEAQTYGGGIRNSHDCIVTLTNCTFYANSAGDGGSSLACTADDGGSNSPSSFQVVNSIFRDGENEIYNGDDSTITVTYSNLRGDDSKDSWPGEGNIDDNPRFADPDNGNFHLKSTAGRFDLNSLDWIIDEVSSPCIDTGDENSLVGDEPEPNGGRINMGAFGGTAQASKSD
jgi:parallel beta-helix repeat protein/predicted outer membrane repeat protein